MREIYTHMHQSRLFDELARATGTEGIIAEYKSRGTSFFLLGDFPLAVPTSYLPGGQDPGEIVVRTASLCKYGLTQEDGFLSQLLHELGHCEAYCRRLDHGCDLLAWSFAGEMAANVTKGMVPEWWPRVRQQALASHGLEWDEDTAKACRLSFCYHGRGTYRPPLAPDERSAQGH
jgi:hypothetical protein